MISISIIIATYNRCANLTHCLDSLCVQDVPEECVLETIIVDNNSTDDTKNVVQSYAARFPRKGVRYLFEGQQGKSYALNAAIAGVKGDVVIFTDDDVLFERGWLLRIYDFIRAYDFDAGGGRILPQYPSNTPAWVKDNIDLISGPVVSYDYGVAVKGYDQRHMNPLVGANMIVKRQLLEEIGGFNTKLGPGAGTFGDDTELCLRWEKKGKRLYYVGTAVVWHPVVEGRMTLGYIARWNMAYGKYHVVKDEGSVAAYVTCWRGIPRYLFRRMVLSAIKLVFSSFNKRRFLTHWVSLFREIGAARAYRYHHLSRAETHLI